jgi:hypothetical protein
MRHFPAKLLPSALLPVFLCIISCSSKENTPLEILKHFDGLMQSKKYEKAKSLCTGQAARMFDFMVLSQEKMLPFIDTVESSEEYLEEKVDSIWAYVRVASRLVFNKPVLGLKEMNSHMAVHFVKGKKTWLISEFEELSARDAAVTLRKESLSTGTAENDSSLFLPVSSVGPENLVIADSAKFQLQLHSDNDIKNYLVQDDFQKVIKTTGRNQVILKTFRVYPGEIPFQSEESDPVLLKDNPYFNLKDPGVIKTANHITAGETDKEKIAGRIYRWVSQNMNFKLGATLFGSAIEVLKHMTGDCSEAAVLTTALLRAKGIPSRVAIGLVHFKSGAFIGHAWSEAWTGHWIALDPALHQFPAGALRIKFAHLDGRQDLRIQATNIMLKLISNLKVEILAVWKDTETVALIRGKDNRKISAEFFSEMFKNLEK